jgi:hypothetical protein
MKKTVRFFLIFIILTALWGLYNGCKTNETLGTFDIRGLWEFVEHREDRETDNHFIVILEGYINRGSVERYPVKDNYWRGTYVVEINEVFIHISYCRGSACMNIYYRGSVISEKLVTGSLEGQASIGGEVYYTWTGAWQLSRE